MSDTVTADVVSGDLYLRHRRRYGEAAQAQTEKGSLTQQAVSAAKSDGVDVDAMKLIRKLQKGEPAIAAAFVRNAMAYAVYEGASFMRQKDMLYGNRSLEEIFAAKPPSEKAVQLWNDAQAEQRGYDEGLDGSPVDNLSSMFEPGTSQYAAAVRGHAAGEKFARGKADNVVAISGGRGRRGKGASTAPAAEVPATEGFAGDRSKMVNLVKAEAMRSAEAMREYYNSFLPEDKHVKKFESRPAALRRLEALYHEQVRTQLGQDAAEEAGAAPAEAINETEAAELAAHDDEEAIIAAQRDEDAEAFDADKGEGGEED